MLMESPAAREMTCHCGWCGAVRQHDGTWDHAADDAADAARPGRVTHGICPDCTVTFRAGMRAGGDAQPREYDVAGFSRAYTLRADVLPAG